MTVHDQDALQAVIDKNFKHYMGILAEDFQSRLALVAESVEMLDEKMERRFAEADAKRQADFDFLCQCIGAVDQKLDRKIDSVEHRLEAKIDSVAQRLDAKIDGVAHRLEAKIDSVAQQLDTKIDSVAQQLDTKIDSVERRLTAEIRETRTELRAIRDVCGSNEQAINVLYAKQMA